MDSGESPENRLPVGKAAFLIAGLGAVTASAGMFYTIWRIFVNPRFWDEIVLGHFVAVIGIPVASGAVFALVVFLRQIEGPIEFEALGFKLKGAAGQVVLWALCFLVYIIALKLLW